MTGRLESNPADLRRWMGWGDYHDRILDDGTDRESWLAARNPVIGASDAAKLSKLSSVDKYLASKLARTSFGGNLYTQSGNRWEPMMLAWAGIPENKALVHAPDERGFAATPDGIQEAHSGLVLAECKAKHDRVIKGPTLGEKRQVAWQFRCFPEAETLEWIWAEVVDGDLRDNEPKHITFRRSDPELVELTRQIEPIAVDLLARLTAALEFERQLV